MAVNINHENDALIVSGSELTVNVPINSSNLKKNNWGASIAPTVNDDIDLGYSVGSRWLNISTDNEWVCTDNTDGAAVWVETSGGGGDTHYIGEGTPSILPNAYGTDSLAMGDGAIANENYNISIGLTSLTGQSVAGSTEIDAIAIGRLSKSYETGGISIGYNATTGKSGTTADPYGIAIGYQASAVEGEAIAIGNSTVASGTTSIAILGDALEGNTVAICNASQAGQTAGGINESYAIAIGYNAKAYEQGGISIGWNSVSGKNGTSADPFNIAIGTNVTAAETYSIAIGNSVATTADNQLVVGNITDSYFGNGVTNASPTNFQINATGGSGTDIAGATLTISGGRGTGTGAGGTIYFKTATPGTTGTSINALVEAMRIEDDQIVTFAQSASFGDAATTRSNLGAASLGMVIALGG